MASPEENAFPATDHRGETWFGLTKLEYLASQVDVSVYFPYETWTSAHGRPPTGEELAEHIADLRIIEATKLLEKLP